MVSFPATGQTLCTGGCRTQAELKGGPTTNIKLFDSREIEERIPRHATLQQEKLASDPGL
jgi:hypothetical protein